MNAENAAATSLTIADVAFTIGEAVLAGHMDETPARFGATARRDVLGGAPPRDRLVMVARFIRHGDGAAA